MNNPFFDASKNIANDFLQNIVFIDDKAYTDNSKVADKRMAKYLFDAKKVSNAFMQKEKICGIYQPENASDIDHLALLARKADVTILDWYIDFGDEQVPEGQEEKDAVSQEPRGEHTLKIIQEVLSEINSLKLILVYTGEIDLEGITNTINAAIIDAKLAGFTTKSCEISSNNIRIFVIAKPDMETDEQGRLISRFKHMPHLNAKVKTYEQLPDFILEEFTKMTSGLLSNFALQSLTILRKNTFKFLSLYGNQLDLSFLIHRLSLPDQEDSQDQVIEIFSRSVEDLLNYYHVGNLLGLEMITKWINTKNINKREVVKDKEIIINNEFINNWARDGFIKACSDIWIAKAYGNISKTLRNEFQEKLEEICKKGSSGIFDNPNNEINDIQFSILTHHKSIFKPHNTPPKLTLGTVIKGTRSNYLVCIQQKCDSVRINDIRKFLFLPIGEIQKDSNEKFNFVTPDNKKLKLKNKSYHIKTIKFRNAPDEDVIKAVASDGKYFFYPIYKQGHKDYDEEKDEFYEWIFDLKDLHAQRIANNYASELSRVGLDESEWLRRRAT